MNSTCAINKTLEIIGGKWKPIVLWYLSQKEMRFGELKKVIPDISEKMLTQTLRELESDQLIVRTVFSEVPPRVEYHLCEKGKSVLPLLDQMNSWGEKHLS